jgi:hypothetical protein
MALTLITADMRLAEHANKTTMVIAGRAKVGKTSLIHTLPADRTLFVDFEAGMKSAQGSAVASVPIRTFEDAVDLACVISGPDPASATGMYSEIHYRNAMAVYGKFGFDQHKIYFFDSITDLTRLAMVWAKVQPEAFSEKTGRPDLRGAYGAVGREVVRLLKHVQHAPGKDIIFIGGLDHYWNDYGKEIFELQTEGQKTGSELPFIVDQIITMSDFDYVEGTGFVHNIGIGKHRALCCKSPNPWGLPAGDRSGNLDLIEEPHLGKLMEKINRPAKAVIERFR